MEYDRVYGWYKLCWILSNIFIRRLNIISVLNIDDISGNSDKCIELKEYMDNIYDVTFDMEMLNHNTVIVSCDNQVNMWDIDTKHKTT